MSAPENPQINIPVQNLEQEGPLEILNTESFGKLLLELFGNNPHPLLILNDQGLYPGNPASFTLLKELGYSDFLSMLGNRRDAFLAEANLELATRRGVTKYVASLNPDRRASGGFFDFAIESKSSGTTLVRVDRIDDELLDPVSKAYNINAYDLYKEELNKILLENPETPIQVIVADTDSLKNINDGISHQAGDEAIRFTTQILMIGRQSDLVFRNGSQSDELFGVKVGSGVQQEERIIKAAQKKNEELTIKRNEQYPDKVNILPQSIASIAIVSSDSELFDPEKNAGQPLNMDIILAVADQMRYAVKRAEKILSRKDLELSQKEIFETALQNVELLMLTSQNGKERNRFYRRVMSQINENNCDKFGLAVTDLPILKLALIGHEVGDHPATQGDKEEVVDPRNERKRIPLYSQQFFKKLAEISGIEDFDRVARIVSRHHLHFNSEDLPIDAGLEIGSADDRMSNIINTIDAFYSMCNRRKKLSELRLKYDTKEAIAMLKTIDSTQFAISIVENLEDLLINAQIPISGIHLADNKKSAIPNDEE